MIRTVYITMEETDLAYMDVLGALLIGGKPLPECRAAAIKFMIGCAAGELQNMVNRQAINPYGICSLAMLKEALNDVDSDMVKRYQESQPHH